MVDRSLDNLYRLCGCCWYFDFGAATIPSSKHYSHYYKAGNADNSANNGANKEIPRKPGVLSAVDLEMNTIAFSPATPTMESQIVQLLLINYFREEPMGKAMGLSVTEVHRWLPAYVHDILAYNCSFVATIDSQIVGVCLNIVREYDNTSKELLNKDVAGKEGLLGYLHEESEPTMYCIAHFFDRLRHDMNATLVTETPSKRTRVMNTCILNVVNGHAGKGICKRLVEISEEEAVNKLDCQIAQADITSDTNRRVFEQLNYSIVKEISFHEDDKFKHIDFGEHQTARVLLKKLYHNN